MKRMPQVLIFVHHQDWKSGAKCLAHLLMLLYKPQSQENHRVEVNETVFQ